MQLGGVCGRGRDLDAVAAQQRRHPIPDERRIVGDHHLQGPAGLAPAHVVHGHPAGEPGQANLARLPHPHVRVVRHQLAHEGGRHHLALASECRQPRARGTGRPPAAAAASASAGGYPPTPQASSPPAGAQPPLPYSPSPPASWS